MPLDHWNRHAAQWDDVGPPLRPCAQDIDLMARRLPAVAGTGRAVLLGVTPEIATMAWPAGTDLLAVDRCMGMVRGVWPFVRRADRGVVCGDWSRLPLADGSVALVVGDGCFTLLDYPDSYHALLDEVHRVLEIDGLFAIRHFCRPERQESAAAVFDDLFAGLIGNFHVLKWRLAMALHGTLEQGVAVGDIWTAFTQRVPDRDALSRQLGWSRAAVDTIDAYRGVATRYTFPTLAELRSVVEPQFAELSLDTGTYELGSRCPLICYRRQ